jgi:hypothetical protein
LLGAEVDDPHCLSARRLPARNTARHCGGARAANPEIGGLPGDSRKEPNLRGREILAVAAHR